MSKFKPKIYIKDESFDPIYNAMDPAFYFRSRVLPAVLISLGILVLVTQVAIPLVFFKTQDKVSKPVESSVLGLASGFGNFEFEELDHVNSVDKNKKVHDKYFYITIPKLGIEDAMVEANSDNLSPDESLGHYNGSALPGELGNAFIYGHSVLPWFYNPKNYKTIFSTINELQPGDKFYVKYNNRKYTYEVEGQEILPVEKVNPLAEIKPKYLNEKTAVLMTCWPAGTKAKRLLVNAVLVEDTK